jgi:hypothetical protein
VAERLDTSALEVKILLKEEALMYGAVNLEGENRKEISAVAHKADFVLG